MWILCEAVLLVSVRFCDRFVVCWCLEAASLKTISSSTQWAPSTSPWSFGAGGCRLLFLMLGFAWSRAMLIRTRGHELSLYRRWLESRHIGGWRKMVCGQVLYAKLAPTLHAHHAHLHMYVCTVQESENFLMGLRTNHLTIFPLLLAFPVATFWLASYRCIVNYTISEPNKQPGPFETYFPTFSTSCSDRTFCLLTSAKVVKTQQAINITNYYIKITIRSTTLSIRRWASPLVLIFSAGILGGRSSETKNGEWYSQDASKKG